MVTAELRRLRGEEQLGPAAIARRLGIGWASVYRVLGPNAPLERLDPNAKPIR